jgi:putative Holliday junction resolvase
MGRLLGIDFGTKRIGIAVTDPLKIIASPLDTIESEKVMKFLEQYCRAEDVEAFIVGWPLDLMNRETHATDPVRKFIEKLQKRFPNTPVHKQDERNTSKMAVQAMVEGGMKKKDRRVKGNIDKISASIILQAYLDFEKL